MKDKKFKDVQPGDWIFTIHVGWVRITDTASTSGNVWAGGFLFSEEGKSNGTHKHPSAWCYNPFDKNDRPPFEFKEGEVVAVRNDWGADWSFDKFMGMEDTSCPFGCGTGSWKYARKLTAEEKGE